MRGPAVAAITLHPAGGGVAAVARLVWDAMQARWKSGATLVTLVPGGQPTSLETSTPARLAFGARIAALQATGRCRWTFYTHVSLAQVQRFVPGPRRPYVVFLHGIEAWRPLTPAAARVLAGATLRVANSRYTAARVRECHPDVGAIAVCPLAVPPAADQLAARSATGSEDMAPQTVVIVARMSAAERYKGHDALLAAWPAVLARRPDAQLMVVGTGDDEVRLRTKARALGLGSRVVFTGFVSDTERDAIYRRAALFAMPSRGEGFGLAYLEAMSHGLPCIGSIHDAAGEVIEDGVTGYLVNQDDTGALAARVVQLLTDEGGRRAMGEAGRRRLEERFSAARFARALTDLVVEGVGTDTGARVSA